ncbi:MAG: hypothetical protein ACD_16C00248G0033 [uncultured bacterium]|nr:MAG: hypothetical protein ACD_16C00248G0033 [uncultured bacterium]OFW68542.1 MAG: hypothetical protein A2X70_02355 [Alphaproteobacteria bacterium GWC2_42_16]OFW73159.1 MAG: hypothetical protein A2Z80_01010 [Alphaproteobacteria bacterium GWA2_41_27]OFW81707.1 MAG: hypothetical protein A3E50_01925 [Alphaproteobacteria bacterium RIFCSPHIGHO2_12_FULL_42_100]OFW86424.1 MAG: hypothetical protein A2W06_05845 [Alphaproteobacteria bacterium RBG_16_42_14]OFW90607.1 MAG: hypothetical protein A3C41_003
MSKSLFFFAGFSLLFCVTSSLSWSMQCEEHDCDESRKTFVSTLPGSGKWKDDVTPKKNWTCQAIEDLESADSLCQMCEREWIRYAHTMQHADYKNLTVGCICAGHMEGDLKASKERESYFRSRSQRRTKWLDLAWKKSKKGNLYIKTRANSEDEDSHIVTIFKGKYGKYSASIDQKYLEQWFPTVREAQYAAFDYLWPSKKIFE